ncbi:MAG TPA: extracellular solute-binding protein, partial [Aggregatilineaceae bacterium]|nr:extracellular solute-binding protein [Aggregatilineaceae bacterium]
GVTITMINNPEGQTDTVKELETQFEQNTGAKLNVEVVPPEQVQPKIAAAAAAGGTQYDVFSTDIIFLPQFAAAGWIATLDDHMTPELQNDILPFAKQGTFYNGHWYGLPGVAEWKNFVYNAAILKDAGFDAPPVTWDDLVKQCTAIKAKGKVQYPLNVSWSQKENLVVDYVAIASAYGAPLFDSKGDPAFNKGDGVTALQLMVDLLNKYKCVDPAALAQSGSGAVSDALKAGMAAYGYLWGTPLFDLNDPAKSKLAGQFKIALAPQGTGPNASPATVAGPEAWVISSGSKNKDAAWQFLKFFAGPEGATYSFIHSGEPAGWKSVIANPDVAAKLKDAGGDIMAQQQLTAVNRPSLPYYAEWSAAAQLEFQNALVGKKTVQQALDDLATATAALKAKFTTTS